MRKMGFYAKLAWGNLLRNRSTYFPYLLASVTSVVTLYTLQAIYSSGSLENMRGASIVMSFTAVGSVIVALFCGGLLFYTNSFLIKRRKKELGLYSILGMEKRNIGILMIFETLFIAGVSLVLGLLLGALLAKALFLLLLRIVQYPVALELPFSAPAFSFTALFFAFVFFLTLLVNLRQVQVANPVQLMAGARQGEKEPRASILLTLLGVGCLAGGYIIAVTVKSPVEALLLFLVAAFLVIIGTYCLFTSGSVALLKLLRRNKNFYYRPRHFVAVSGMIYRMKQNAVGLAGICVLSCMVLVTVSSTVSLYAGSEDSLLNRYPNEYRVVLDNADDGQMAVAGIEALAGKHGLTIEKMNNLSSFTAYVDGTKDTFVSSADWEASDGLRYVQVMLLDEYNTAEGTRYTLQDDEALLFSLAKPYEYKTLVLDGITYQLPHTGKTTQRGYSGIMGESYLLVLPNRAAVERLAAAQPPEIQQYREGRALLSRSIGFDFADAEQGVKSAFYDDLITYLQDTPKAAAAYVESREDARLEWYMTNGGFLFLGLYFGTLFLLAAAMIIYYKQISEGYDDHDRYEVLQKVGMSGDEVRRTVQSQIRMVFFLPLGTAAVHILFAFFPVSRAMPLFGITNQLLLAVSTALAVLAYVLIYAFIYRRTAKTYYRLVRREA